MKEQLASMSYPFLSDLQLRLAEYQTSIEESKGIKAAIKSSKELVISMLKEGVSMEDFYSIRSDFSEVAARF